MFVFAHLETLGIFTYLKKNYLEEVGNMTCNSSFREKNVQCRRISKTDDGSRMRITKQTWHHLLCFLFTVPLHHP